MRTILLPLLLSACNDKPRVYDPGDSGDTGTPQCGRVRGTEGILLYQEGGATIRPPLEIPDATDLLSGVAGPVGDELTYVAAGTTRTYASSDAGCNWTTQGSLEAGNWRLRAAGDRVYAFDMDSSAGARTDDLGLTWTPFDVGERFVGVPVVDPSDPSRIRGLQARGVVTSTDGGDTWQVDNSLPAGLAGATDGDLFPGDLDVAIVGGTNGAWRTEDGGINWLPIVSDANVTALAIHPDDRTVFFEQSTVADVRTISRSADAGGTWARQVDSDQVALGTAPELWPVPGNTAQALAAYGPVYNEDVEANGLNLYIVTAGEGTRTFFVATWFHLHQFAFGADRWVASVDAVGAR